MEIGSLFAEFPWGWNEFLPWCSFELLQVTMSPSFWINKPELIIYKVWILYVTACQSFISAPYTLLGCLELSLAWAMPSHRVSFWWWERLVRSPPPHESHLQIKWPKQFFKCLTFSRHFHRSPLASEAQKGHRKSRTQFPVVLPNPPTRLW